MNWETPDRLVMPARPPFDLTTVIRSHGWVQLAPFERGPEDASFRYVDQLSSGQVIVLAVEPWQTGVRVNVLDGAEEPAALNPAERAEAAAHISWMLQPQADFSEFYAQAAGEPKLAHVIAGGNGRLLHSPTFFEDVVKTILTTNIAWGGTISMARRLVENFGAPLPGDPERRAFPTPQALAAASPEALKSAARLGYRAPYVFALAQQQASGEIDLEAYKHSDLPTPELRKALLKVNGVGPYAAAHLLLLLGRYDFIPIDSYAFKLVSQEWHGGEPVGEREVEAAFARWERFKALSYWFWKWTDEA